MYKSSRYDGVEALSIKPDKGASVVRDSYQCYLSSFL